MVDWVSVSVDHLHLGPSSPPGVAPALLCDAVSDDEEDVESDEEEDVDKIQASTF